ncbi:MAG TPA: hypothetical protein VFQ65_29965 [Kofleriaceae bacterium]|nr:hypothetical protein [Kofleriaceae bacterium]
MKRFLLLVLACGACGDNLGSPLTYTDPSGGKLRLVRDARTETKSIVLDLVVGDQPLTGYSVGFDLPVDDTRVTLGAFTPATALDPGSEPVAAKAAMPRSGPLAHELVTALSQKAGGTGAVAADTTLAPGALLYSIQLDLIGHAPNGVVFDGTASDFVLPSGGMRDRLGNTVVEAKDVAIGKLEIAR